MTFGFEKRDNDYDSFSITNVRAFSHSGQELYSQIIERPPSVLSEQYGIRYWRASKCSFCYFAVIRSKSQFCSFIYACAYVHMAYMYIYILTNLRIYNSEVCGWEGEKAAPASLSHLSFGALSPPHVHPVNYFVSGYLQRAVNSCRADYTDRFIALVSQSNVCNARVASLSVSSLGLRFSLSLFRLFQKLNALPTKQPPSPASSLNILVSALFCDVSGKSLL